MQQKFFMKFWQNFISHIEIFLLFFMISQDFSHADFINLNQINKMFFGSQK